MTRAILLMGPTASGKTDLAISLCKRLPCELISVDSALVYRGMDIGTAKPTAATLERTPHRLIDIRDPEETYSAGEFVRDAYREIDAIVADGRIPLLAGGTMMYFRALTRGIAELPRADQAVRDAIDAEARERGWPAMHAEARWTRPLPRASRPMTASASSARSRYTAAAARRSASGNAIPPQLATISTT